MNFKEVNFIVYKDMFFEKYLVEKKSKSVCLYFVIEWNVGFCYGLKIGRFFYVGELFDIERCFDVCC